jgi:pimeloyl-ACP methyl ester carboxylesterase
MFDDETQLREMAEHVVTDMLAANVAEKKLYTDQRLGREYFNLITPNAFDKKLVVIAVLGYPERAGVWSYTLLSQSRISETSMQLYFQEFTKHDIGLVAIDPNCFGPDIEGDSFIYQLEQAIADIDPDSRIGFIGFSMGGRVLVDFLEQHPQLLDRMSGLVLIDPTLPNRLKVENIRRLLDSETLLIASQGEITSPGEIASALLAIPKTSIQGIHGEMPNKAIRHIIKFYEVRLP